uniref:Uncharacterized protein n=1 Tax=Naja naja TaxID=35670 RepID=A0A8C7E3N5_NAJNA
MPDFHQSLCGFKTTRTRNLVPYSVTLSPSSKARSSFPLVHGCACHEKGFAALGKGSVPRGGWQHRHSQNYSTYRLNTEELLAPPRVAPPLQPLELVEGGGRGLEEEPGRRLRLLGPGEQHRVAAQRHRLVLHLVPVDPGQDPRVAPVGPAEGDAVQQVGVPGPAALLGGGGGRKTKPLLLRLPAPRPPCPPPGARRPCSAFPTPPPPRVRAHEGKTLDFIVV